MIPVALRRLVITILLLALFTGPIYAVVPSFTTHSDVKLVSNPDSRIPLTFIPDSIDIVAVSPNHLAQLELYCSKYVPTNFASSPSPAPYIFAVDATEPSNRACALHLLRKSPDPMVIVWMGPSAPSQADVKVPLLILPDASSASQALAAQAIFGGIDLSQPDGSVSPRTRLGFASPADMGFNDSLVIKIDSIIAVNIRARSFPGCQVIVAKDGYVVLDKAYGTLDYDHPDDSVTTSTLYDVASMSKVLGTVPGIMTLFDNGLVSSHTCVSRFLPRLRRESLADLTVADFLYHRTGIVPTVNTYKLLFDPESYSGKLVSRRRVSPYSINIDRNAYLSSEARLIPDLFTSVADSRHYIPVASGMFASSRVRELIDSAIYNPRIGQRKYLYSCLNFCMLKDMEEAITGIPHDQFLADSIFGPIGAYSTCFSPLQSGRYSAADIAPTECEPAIRRQLLRGYVHDEIAAFSGGVQGNAGLFSTALDAAKICQTWLQRGVYGGVDIFSSSTVDIFTSSVDSVSTRALGFDLIGRTASWRDTGASPTAYGHTGFTGTCCWVDPKHGLVYVFLCNRLCPSRQNDAFTRLNPRAEILKTIIDSL